MNGVLTTGKRVAVTGATGKLGQRLVAALIERGVQVKALTREPRRAAERFPDPRIEWIRGDLTNPGSLPPLLASTNVLFHLASHSPGPGAVGIYQASEHWQVSAEGTAHLLAAAAQAAVPTRIYLSSVMAMGAGTRADGAPADELTEARPASLYGLAKRAAELQLLTAGTASGQRATVLRAPMVYGIAGEGNLVQMITAIARGRFPTWPRHENLRSAVHADDLVAALLLAAEHRAAAGRLYLVTDGQPFSTRWLDQQIRQALGRSTGRGGLPLGVWRAAAAVGSLLERVSRGRMPLTRERLDKLRANAHYSSARIEHELGFRASHSLASVLPGLVTETCANLRMTQAPRAQNGLGRDKNSR